MKKIHLILFCLIITLTSYAQKSGLTFESKSYDFGKIEEELGKVTYIFNFTNTGNAPLVISNVQASCGCTTPVWTKEPIEAGKKGTINVTYNTADRPGVFNKTITVISNAGDPVVLTIKGDVISRFAVDNTTEQRFPAAANGIRLKSKVILLNNIEKGKSVTKTIEIFNAAKNSVKPSVDNLPKYISVTFSPEVLKPNETGKLTFSFNSADTNEWGPVTDIAYLNVDGQKTVNDNNQLKIITNIIEDFSKLTLDQKRKAPIFDSPTQNIDLGTIKAGAKKTSKIAIGNKGINNLEIRRIINYNKEITIQENKTSVAGGKQSSILAIIDTKSLPAGDYKKSFTVQTNDPDHSVVMFVINWKILK
jgi:hypothetical protein